MRRRSVPFLDYPPEQIDALRAAHPAELAAATAGGGELSEQVLEQIVEEVARQQLQRRAEQPEMWDFFLISWQENTVEIHGHVCVV